MSFEGLDYATLAREIAARMDPDALIDTADIGSMVKRSARYVEEEYVPAPGFPKPVRLVGKSARKSHALWRRRDITAWIEAHGEKKAGRPRRQPDLA
jgi:predicted DNA-binding transcriptional regulator AlpA